ncbi:MAG: DUF2442 domain-containing protein [Caldilineaceae bacterium]|nr:DUF2442 domain-containing protein [Caldilineaceae bacterium]
MNSILVENEKVHNIKMVKATELYLMLHVDGEEVHILWEECSQRLARASFEERSHIEVSPSGYGLHWPLVDEDLAISPLLLKAESINPASHV